MRFALILLLTVLTAAPAFAHPFHAEELGFLHASMHALGVDAHSLWLSPASRMLLDGLLISLGIVLALTPRARTSFRLFGALTAAVFIVVF